MDSIDRWVNYKQRWDVGKDGENERCGGEAYWKDFCWESQSTVNGDTCVRGDMWKWHKDDWLQAWAFVHAHLKTYPSDLTSEPRPGQ